MEVQGGLERGCQPYTLTAPWSSSISATWAPLLCGVCAVSSDVGPHHTPLHLQLQQTEAELRKVDEAIALFQKML